MQIKIGEVFEFQGDKFQAVMNTSCDGCHFDAMPPKCKDLPFDCRQSQRPDGKSVSFEKVS